MSIRNAIQIAPVFHAVGQGNDNADRSAPAPAYLSFAQFCQQIDALEQPSIVRLQGSCDPLLHLHFCDMVRYAVARGHRVTAHTCLTVLPQYRADECMQCGLDTITIALDAADADTYQAIHGKARFDKIRRNLRRLMAAKARHAVDLPDIELVCTVIQRNLAQLADLVAFAHEEGITRIRVQHIGDASADTEATGYPQLYDYAGEADLRQDDPLRVAFHFNRARQRAQKLDIALHLPQLPTLPRLASAWRWLHNTRPAPHYLRQPRQSGSVCPVVPPALPEHKSLPASSLAAASGNSP